MQLFKSYILKSLVSAVRQFFITNPNIKLVVVVGSIGKTGTKAALGHVLSQKFKVRTSRGNLNAALSAPLEILGVDGPNNPRNPLEWLKVVSRAKKASKQPTDIEIIVQECGTDHPGDIPQFASYLCPDVTIITAITPEHMEFFADLDSVAREETATTRVSEVTIYNQDDISPRHLELIESAQKISYGSDDSADTWLEVGEFKFAQGFICRLHIGDKMSDEILIPVLGIHQLRILVGAAAVADNFGIDIKDITQALGKITHVEGRMQLLAGLNDSSLIDDSYNSSPAAVIMALKTLYDLPHGKKIAVLGGMNELGEETAGSHREVAGACDPERLDLVITVGELAKEHLVPSLPGNIAHQHVNIAPEAAKILTDLLNSDTAVLFKGSQGGIFLEEAIKPLLKKPTDQTKLVRQSSKWLKTKQDFFDQN